MALRWYISIGSSWLPLDDLSARNVEYCWSRNHSQYINSGTFRGPVYVNLDRMSIVSLEFRPLYIIIRMNFMTTYYVLQNLAKHFFMTLKQNIHQTASIFMTLYIGLIEA
ncbi:hypothetical protein BDF21DRAFT_404324 [Thamnidium elegans]|nr:hypothetical protein BDF21DRAFT_404324 [Thamnidium elegans]